MRKEGVTKILVIDDEPSLRDMLDDILTMEGFTVITAGDGEEGLKKIYGDQPDLIILDCSMPVLDGYEVLGRIRKDPALYSKPVIMLTVLSGEFDEIRGLELGADDYITKPFRSAQLIARIKAVLERKGLK